MSWDKEIEFLREGKKVSVCWYKHYGSNIRTGYKIIALAFYKWNDKIGAFRFFDSKTIEYKDESDYREKLEQLIIIANIDWRTDLKIEQFN